jgi:hypothetical protein
VESFTERHRTDKFFSVQDFQSISVEQWMREGNEWEWEVQINRIEGK